MANYINNLGQIRLGWRSPVVVVSNQPTISAPLLQSLYGVWNGDTNTNELDKSLFGVWNKGDNNSTVKNAWNANGNFIDSKGGANGVVVTPSGTTFLSGTMSFGTGKLGSGAFSFSGSNFISLPSGTLNFTSDFSLSFWIYVPTSFGTNYSRVLTAFDNSDGWNTYRGWDTTYSNGNMYFTIYNGIGTDYYSISVPMTLKDQWVHVSVTKVIGQQGNIYINGVAGVKTVNQRGSGASSNIISYKGSNHLAYIAADYYAFSLPYYTPTPAGGFKIDSIQTWDGVALDATAVSELYNSGIGQEYPFTISNAPIGTTKDSFGTNHGTLMNGCTFTTGKIGSAFTFDGINDYVALPDNIFNFTGDFSASVWFYSPSATYTHSGIVGNYNFATGTGWGIYTYQNRLYAQLGNVGGNYSTVYIDNSVVGSWNHVSMVFKKGTGFYLYMNGELKSSFTLTNNSNAGTSPSYSATQKAYIGLLNYSGDWWYAKNGYKIDGVNVWQRAISQDEITQLYNSGTGAQYPFTGTFSSAGNQLGMDNGTLVNGCYLSDGKIGKAFTFDGVNDYVSLPNNSLNFTGDFSIGLWVYFNSLNNPNSQWNQQFIFSNSAGSGGNNYGYYLYKHSNNNLMFVISNGTPFSSNAVIVIPQSISQSTWYHLLITRKYGTSTKVYINGVEMTSAYYSTGNSSINPLYLTNQVVNLSGYGNATGDLFNGKIDGFTTWQKELTQAEVTELYNSGTGKQITATPIVQTGLILNLDASRKSSYTGTGTTWTDISGSGNNGTMVNGPVFGTASGGQITFDGVNDRITLQNTNISATGNWTISSWFNLSTLNLDLVNGAAAVLYSQYLPIPGNGRFLLLVRNDGTITNKFELFLGSGTGYSNQKITGTTTAQINTTYNLVAIRNGSVFSLYLNGNLEASVDLTGTNISLLQSTTEIGGVSNGNFGWVNGKIYNTMVYNRALSATEITQNFNATKSRFGL